MPYRSLQSPEALLFVPLVLGYVGIAICIAVMAIARWTGRERPERMPTAVARARARRVLDRRPMTP
jgi:hypothetical protein